MDIMGSVEKLPKLFGCPWRIDLVNGVNGLTRGQVMGGRSDAADSGDNPRDLFYRSSQTEDLKSPQLRNLKIGIFNIPLIVQKKFNLPMSFQSGDWIDRYLFHGNLFFLNAEAGKPNR